MMDINQEGLAACGLGGKKNSKRKGTFTTVGLHWLHSLDGHDQLSLLKCMAA